MFALLYADDAVLLAESAEDLQNLINIVDEYCRDWRMLLNLDKSKAMVVPKQVKNKTAAEVIKSDQASRNRSWSRGPIRQRVQVPRCVDPTRPGLEAAHCAQRVQG